MKNDLYLLQDGTHADPKDVSRGKDGVLRHKNGLAVSLREDGEPMTVGSGAVENKNVMAAEAGKDAEPLVTTESLTMPAVEPEPAKAKTAKG